MCLYVSPQGSFLLCTTAAALSLRVMEMNEYRGGLGQLRNSEERRVLLQSGTG